MNSNNAQQPNTPLSEGQQPADQNLKINKKGFIELTGEVIELLPGLKFKVELENGHEITATMAGKMRINRITLVVGDRVKLEMSPYDMSKGRITFRN
jgi:translation initiation factor IF-1